MPEEYNRYYEEWKPGEEGGTSINHQALNHIESGIKQNSDNHVTHKADYVQYQRKLRMGAM